MLVEQSNRRCIPPTLRGRAARGQRARATLHRLALRDP